MQGHKRWKIEEIIERIRAKERTYSKKQKKRAIINLYNLGRNERQTA